MAAITARALCPLLRERFPEHATGACEPEATGTAELK